MLANFDSTVKQVWNHLFVYEKKNRVADPCGFSPDPGPTSEFFLNADVTTEKKTTPGPTNGSGFQYCIITLVDKYYKKSFILEGF